VQLGIEVSLVFRAGTFGKPRRESMTGQKITTGINILALAMFANVPARAATSTSACRLLTPAQVSAAVGVNVDGGATVPTVRNACVWRESGKSSSDTPPLVEVQLLTAQDFDRIKTFRAKTMPSESALGDEAHFFRDAITGGFQLIVKSGTTFFSVVSWPPHPGSNQSAVDDERCKAIEKALARAIMGKTP
jgi:hypothetical protein